MKRNIFVILLMAAVMAMTFTACGRRGNDAGDVSESPSPEVSATPDVSPSPDTSPDVSPDTSPDTGNENSLPETDGQVTGELREFRDAVKGEYGEHYIPSRELTATEIQELTGLTPDMYVDIYGEGSENDADPDVFIVVHAAEGQAEAVKEKLENFKSSMGDKYTDERLFDKLEAARVYQNGDYVFMMLLGENTMLDGDNGNLGDDAENAAETIGDRLKKSADNAIQAIEDLIGVR